jgi:Pyruvate/2-oxoacid:ferredoxin oxidoreductase gamma subunit
MERCRMVFSGSGGQGVITAAIILAESAVLHENLTAVQTQAYGAAARGGATRSDVIISDSQINFPKVIQPNVLVCLTQESYNKFYDIIRPGGLLISDSRYVQPQLKVDARQRELPMYETVMDKIGKTDRVQYLHAGCGGGDDRPGAAGVDHEGARSAHPRGLSGDEPAGPGTGAGTGPGG